MDLTDQPAREDVLPGDRSVGTLAQHTYHTANCPGAGLVYGVRDSDEESTWPSNRHVNAASV
jgi:hypothetical protein